MTELTPDLARKEFNRNASEESAKDYEYRRWFQERGGWENYRIMVESLRHHTANINFKRYLEVGPGPGTWTRFFLKHSPESDFTLVDISREMLGQAKASLGERKNLTYMLGDFLETPFKKKFDYFFCSRAIEYFPDKAAYAEKVFANLEKGGAGMLITKNPEALSRKLERIIGRTTPTIHSGRINYRSLQQIFSEVGFSSVECFPCVINFPPGLKMHILSRSLWRRWHQRQMDKRINPWAESYILKFQKS